MVVACKVAAVACKVAENVALPLTIRTILIMRSVDGVDLGVLLDL